MNSLSRGGKGFLILPSSLLDFPTQAGEHTWESTENVCIALPWAETPEVVHTIKAYFLLTSLTSTFWMVVQESRPLPSGRSAFLQICGVSIKPAGWGKRVRPLSGSVPVAQAWN